MNLKTKVRIERILEDMFDGDADPDGALEEYLLYVGKEGIVVEDCFGTVRVEFADGDKAFFYAAEMIVIE